VFINLEPELRQIDHRYLITTDSLGTGPEFTIITHELFTDENETWQHCVLCNYNSRNNLPMKMKHDSTCNTDTAPACMLRSHNFFQSVILCVAGRDSMYMTITPSSRTLELR
jgi:hypothetical protein